MMRDSINKITAPHRACVDPRSQHAPTFSARLQANASRRPVMTAKELAFALVAGICLATPCGGALAQHAPQEKPFAPTASPRERVEAFLAAINTGEAAAFEKAALENLSAEAYAKRSPLQRAQTVQRVASDFGRLQIISITVTGEGARAIVRGETGLNGAFAFTFDSAPEQRITGVNIEVGGGPPGAGSPNVPPASVRPDMNAADMRSAIDGWIKPFVDQDDFAGTILLAKNGRPFVTLEYGNAKRAPATPATSETAYNIASIGKRFTQAVVARLIQEGKLSLTTRVGDVIKDYPNAQGRTATVEQLIAMRGGVADINTPKRQGLPSGRFASNHDYFVYVSSLPQRFAPGSHEEYCNGCYVVLGEMVARLTGMRFEDYVQRAVFDPAGMRRTGYFHRNKLLADTALAYARASGPGGEYTDVTHLEGLAGNGAGGFYSTVGDLLAFDNALRDGRLLKAEMTAWVLGGTVMTDRNTTLLDIKGGAPGAAGSYTSNGQMSVFLLSNLGPPLPIQIADAIAQQLLR